MTGNSKDNFINGQEERNLDELIQIAINEMPDDVKWPDEETILAYISGTATENQKSTVQDVLIRSNIFRRMLVDLATAVENIASPESGKTFDSIQLPNLPRVKKLIHEEIPDKNNIIFRIINKLKQLFSIRSTHRLLVPAVSVVAVILVAITGTRVLQFGDEPQQLEVATMLEPSYFLSSTYRGYEDIISLKPDDAAYRAFGGRVSYSMETNKCILLPDPSEVISSPFKKPEVRLLGSDRELLAIFTPKISDSVTLPLSEIEIWILSLPSLSVIKHTISENQTDLCWPQDLNPQGCVTFTYRVNGGYTATPAEVFDLR